MYRELNPFGDTQVKQEEHGERPQWSHFTFWWIIRAEPLVTLSHCGWQPTFGFLLLIWVLRSSFSSPSPEKDSECEYLIWVKKSCESKCHVQPRAGAVCHYSAGLSCHVKSFCLALALKIGKTEISFKIPLFPLVLWVTLAKPLVLDFMLYMQTLHPSQRDWEFLYHGAVSDLMVRKSGEGIGDGFWSCRGLHLLARPTSHQFGGSDECQAFVTGLSTVQPQRRQGRSTGQEEYIMWCRETQEAGLSLDLYTRQGLPQEFPCTTPLRWFGIDMLSWGGTRFWLLTLILSKLTPAKKTCESNKPF